MCLSVASEHAVPVWHGTGLLLEGGHSPASTLGARKKAIRSRSGCISSGRKVAQVRAAGASSWSSDNRVLWWCGPDHIRFSA